MKKYSKIFSKVEKATDFNFLCLYFFTNLKALH